MYQPLLLSMLKELYEGSAYTIIGVGGELNTWVDGYQELLDEKGIGKVEDWYVFTGKDLNTEYGLTGEDAFDEDIRFLAFPLTGLDVEKLAIFRIRMGDKWFDDFVDNFIKVKKACKKARSPHL